MADKVLYNRADSNADWDDEELIRMYDRTTAKTHEKLNKKNKNNGNKGKSTNVDPSPNKTSGSKIWKVGDTCMALYEVDGHCYSAKILAFDRAKNKYQVLYMDYNEKAFLNPDELYHGSSDAPRRQDVQESSRSALNELSGESWRKSESTTAFMSSSWKSAATASRHETGEETWFSGISSTSTWLVGRQPYNTVDNIETTWKLKSHQLHNDEANRDAVNVSLATREEEEIQRHGMIKKEDSIVTAENAWRHTRQRTLSDASFKQPDCKRLRSEPTSLPSPLINAPPPPTYDLDLDEEMDVEGGTLMQRMYGGSCDSLFDKNIGVKQSVEDNRLAAHFKRIKYSRLSDYSFYSGLLHPKSALDRYLLETMNGQMALSSHSSQQKSAKIYYFTNSLQPKIGDNLKIETVTNIDTMENIANVPIMEYRPTSYVLPNYPQLSIRQLGRYIGVLARNYANNNAARPFHFRDVFDFQSEQTLQKMAQSCLGSLSRARYCSDKNDNNENSMVIECESVIYNTELRTTVRKKLYISNVGNQQQKTNKNENNNAIYDGDRSRKAFDDGSTSVNLYLDTIHEKLRQLPESALNVGDGEIDLSYEEVEWTDSDMVEDENEPTTISVVRNGKQETFPIPDLCPPPPPALFGKIAQAGNNKEALTNMLMSWYMSGYHTGYYQGMMHHNQSKASTSKRSS